MRCAVAALRTGSALQVTRVRWESAAGSSSTHQASALKRGLGGNRNVRRRSEEPAPPEEQDNQYTSGQREFLEPQVLSGFFAPFCPHKKGLAAGAAKQTLGRDCQKRGPRRGRVTPHKNPRHWPMPKIPPPGEGGRGAPPPKNNNTLPSLHRSAGREREDPHTSWCHPHSAPQKAPFPPVFARRGLPEAFPPTLPDCLPPRRTGAAPSRRRRSLCGGGQGTPVRSSRCRYCTQFLRKSQWDPLLRRTEFPRRRARLSAAACSWG